MVASPVDWLLTPLLSVLCLVFKLGTRTSLRSERPVEDACRNGLAQPLACIQGVTSE